jgi:hypothetical protein
VTPRDRALPSQRGHLALPSWTEALQDVVDLVAHVLFPLLGGGGSLGREVDEDVAVANGLLAECLQTFLPQLFLELFGFLTLGG